MNKCYLTAAAMLLAAALSGCAQNIADISTEEEVYVAELPDTEASDIADTAAASEITETQTEAQTEISDISVSCADITARILESVEMSSMAQVGADRIAIYLDFEIPEDTDFSMYICGSGGFADEICVIKLDEEQSDEFEAAVESRIESRKKDFEGYNPDECEKLENYYFEYSDGYCIYAVTGDNDACADIFASFIG